MNTQPDITDDEDMPADGALKNEKVLGAEAREAISRAEKLFDKHAQLVEQDVFTTASYDVECTFARSGGPELSCDRFGERHLRLVLGPTGHAHILTVSSAEGCCSTEKVLEPGMTWSQGPFVCRYARNDLTCERERHGFRIGRKVVVAY